MTADTLQLAAARAGTYPLQLGPRECKIAALVKTYVDSVGVIATAQIADAAVTIVKLDPSIMLEATGTLTQANIVAMNGAPVALIAAPGAGKLIIVDEIELFHDYSTAAYTSGGDISIEYATSGVDIQTIDVGLLTETADSNEIMKPSAAYTSTASTSSHTDLSTSINKGVQITNATGAFATGNVANIVKYRLRYHVVTVLT